MVSSRRSVGLYATLLGATILLGLATRALPAVFPELIARYGGDTMWAAMVVWIGALLRPAVAPRTLGVAALAIATVVELGQLYQAPWITAVRDTHIGALVFGQGFRWSDLLCYAIGVMLALVLDARIVRRSRSGFPNHGDKG